MNKPRVNAEQAKMLKALGYDVPDTHYYEEHLVKGMVEEVYFAYDEANYNDSITYFTRPTLDDAARWLREVKGWHVGMEPIYHNRSCWQANVVAVPLLELHDYVIADTYDEALSEGISLILKKLTNAQ